MLLCACMKLIKPGIIIQEYEAESAETMQAQAAATCIREQALG